MHVNFAVLRNILFVLIIVLGYLFWSLNRLQSVGGTCGYNYITGGVLFKAKGLFGLKNRPLHSASVNKTKSNGTAVKEKQCEQTHGFSGLQFSR